MEVVVLTAVQAPTNVEKGKEIVTLMPTAVAVWNVAKAMVLVTIAILHWDSLRIMTAAMNQVRLIKSIYIFCICVYICRESEFVENCTSSTLKTLKSSPNKLWMTVVYN